MTLDLLDQQQDQKPQVDPNKNYLEELVGPDKKFKTVEDLARGKYEADLYISHKNQEFDTLRDDYLKIDAEYKTVPKLQEILDRLDSQQSTRDDNTQQRSDDDSRKPEFDISKIDELLTSKLTERDKQRKEEDNFKTSMSKLKEKWGENYASTLKTQMDTLGLDKDFVNQLARTHPQVLFRTLGMEQDQRRESFDAPMRTQQRNDNFSPSTNKRTWNYYQQIKKNSPAQYLDPKTQTQMLKDRQELGEAFKDGDYNNF